MTTPDLPGLPTVTGLSLIALICVWLGVAGPIDISKLQNWQTLLGSVIGGAIAATGILIAVRNVGRQIRVGILTREEDRIDRELPGLRDARRFCLSFTVFGATQSFHGFNKAFGDNGFGIAGSTLPKDIENALPNTDASTRLSVLNVLRDVFIAGWQAQVLMEQLMADRDRSTAPAWAPEVLRQLQAEMTVLRAAFSQSSNLFRERMAALDAFILQIDERTQLYERRRARIRKEIETFFGDTD